MTRHKTRETRLKNTKFEGRGSGWGAFPTEPSGAVRSSIPGPVRYLPQNALQPWSGSPRLTGQGPPGEIEFPSLRQTLDQFVSSASTD
jgi:hypothetical protein